MPGLAGPRQHCRSHPEPCRVERQPDTLTTRMRHPVAVQPLQRSRLDIVEVQRGLIPVAARGMGHEQELVPIRAPAKRTSHNNAVDADVDRSVEHKSELPSLKRNSYDVFC